jgi:hypothetical protein
MMIYRSAISLLFLAVAPAAHAITIDDDTPARAITIGKPEGDLKRVVITDGVISMRACRQALEDNKDALKANSVVIMCLPTDLSGSVTGDLPFIDLTN